MRLDISIVFIGDGQQKPALHDRCEAQQLSNVSFHDPMPKTKLAATLADVDVGLMILANVPAFYYGTSPNKFFDYIALGMPVLNNYPGWLADMIESEDIGVVVPPENPVEFAAALEYLADNPGLRAEMGRRARSFAERKFNRNDLSELWVTEIERVASN
jgi:glycosyltransferase involved in cell wall biosynthesis